MRGNVYMCLNTTTYNAKIPTELVATYGIPSYDEEGEFVETLHPTFKELGAYNLQKFGAVPVVTIDSSEYYIVELEVSWKEGETSALIKLGEGLAYPNNTLMTNTEASQFIIDNATDVI
tara:strand:- start:4276 stop:4632 length:357 start_codon:yes stop_codon:yes gene_type:complete